MDGTDRAVFHGMFFALGVLVIASGSLAVIVNGLRKAPEAYEDEDGFHIVRAYAGRSRTAALKRHSKKRESYSGAHAALDLQGPAAVGRH